MTFTSDVIVGQDIIYISNIVNEYSQKMGPNLLKGFQTPDLNL